MVKKDKKTELKSLRSQQVKLEEELKQEELKEIAIKRQGLIGEVSQGLLTNAQLKKGGSDIRVRYEIELGRMNIIQEINDLGKKLGIAPIGLGHLRK